MNVRPLLMTLVLGLSLGGSSYGRSNASTDPQSLGTGMVYTANEAGRSVSAVALQTGQVRTVPLPVAPHNIQISADGLRLYVVGHTAGGHGEGHSATAGHDADSAGRLLVLDARWPDLPIVADISVGPHPAHVVADADGRRAFVSDAERNAVLVVDLRERKVIRSIPTGAYPHGLRLSPDGRRLYVANLEDGSVSVISTTELEETARIPVGKAPVQVAVAPDGRRLYVSLRDENRVAVVDTARLAVIMKVVVGRGPIQDYVTPNGQTLFVANEGTSANPDDTVTLMDTQTNLVVKTLTTGSGAHGVAISTDSRRAFVTNSLDNTLSIIDVVERRVLRTLPVGDGPAGVTYQGPSPRP